MTNRVLDKDKGYKQLMKAMAQLSKDPYILVGITREKGSKKPDGSKATVAEYGTYNEFGTGIVHGRSGAITIRVPERSFLRSTVDERRERYFKLLLKAIDDEIMGKHTIRFGFSKVGERAAADVRRKIRTLREPPNAPATIERKGSSNPLVDKGPLIESIHYEFKPSSKGVAS